MDPAVDIAAEDGRLAADRRRLPAPREGFAADVVDALRRHAALSPARVAFRFLDGRLDAVAGLSFAALDRRARALAAVLQDRTAPGDRALLVYPPGLDVVVALFGCFHAGVVAVPAPVPRAGKGHGRARDRLDGMIGDCDPALVLTTMALAEGLGAADSPVACLPTDNVPEALAAGWRDHRPDPDDVAFLQYTSGSTGAPKGVVVRHRNLAANLTVIHSTIAHPRDGTFVTWLPHFHDMGLIGTLFYPVAVGGECLVMSPVAFVQRPIRWLRAISRHRACTSGAPNFAYDHCVARTTPEERAELDLSCWTLAFNGAEPVRAGTLERFAETFAPHGFRREAFFPCYGLAESTLMATGGRRGQGARLRAADPAELAEGILRDAAARGTVLVSSGTPQPGHRVEIVDPRSAEPLPAGHVGEIRLAGPSVSDGYWGRPAAASEPPGAGGGRVLRTGDLGALWDGELYVVGRLKDLILVDGRNHRPEDIERSLEAAHPAFRAGACAAFSIDADGAEQLVVALECEARGAAPDGLAAAAREAVARDHGLSLRALVLLRPGRLPRTTSGKLRRDACRERYRAGDLGEAA